MAMSTVLGCILSSRPPPVVQPVRHVGVVRGRIRNPVPDHRYAHRPTRLEHDHQRPTTPPFRLPSPAAIGSLVPSSGICRSFAVKHMAPALSRHLSRTALTGLSAEQLPPSAPSSSARSWPCRANTSDPVPARGGGGAHSRRPPARRRARGQRSPHGHQRQSGRGSGGRKRVARDPGAPARPLPRVVREPFEGSCNDGRESARRGRAAFHRERTQRGAGTDLS